MQKIYDLGSYQLFHYFQPGKKLDDLSLKKLHVNLIKVNEKSGSNIKHKMLIKNSSLDEIRKSLADTVIALLFIEQEACGFMISPILHFKKRPILHSGLMIIEKNPGGDLLRFLGVGNYLLAYQQLGHLYLTNISSTPSSIEGFIETTSKSWPGPDVGMKRAPTGYKEVVQTLKQDYMDVYFPDADKLSVDYRRFVLTSNSQEMGFSTNFYQASRANDFKYNLFCHTWIDYQREEDVIQVAEMNMMTYLRMHYMHFKLEKLFFKLSQKKTKERELAKIYQDDKKAA